eukprot:322206-Amorphochlora_amoeboformis.AAC.2
MNEEVAPRESWILDMIVVLDGRAGRRVVMDESWEYEESSRVDVGENVENLKSCGGEIGKQIDVR